MSRTAPAGIPGALRRQTLQCFCPFTGAMTAWDLTYARVAGTTTWVLIQSERLR